MANINKSQPQFHNTFGREPTLNKSSGKDKEGNTSMKVTASGKTGNPDEGAIERAINRNAKGFRNDVVKRSQKVRGKRRRVCD